MAKADVSTLPPGWRLENGYLTLEDARDEWIFKDDKLIRRHYLPRNHYFEPTEQDAGCPLPLHYLSKDRHTLDSDNLNQYGTTDGNKRRTPTDNKPGQDQRSSRSCLPTDI